jgi:hypothetical protein
MGFEDEFENTEILVSFKIVVEELLRRITYMVEIAQNAVETEDWGLMAGALTALEEANCGIADVTAAATHFVSSIGGVISATTIETWVEKARQQAYRNGYEMSVEAQMVQRYANEQLGL